MVIEMKISTKGRYALMIMIYLAQHYKENRFITLKEISQKEGISLKYLEKIIVLINKDNFLLSQRGSEGGYKLSNEPKNYYIYDIITKAEGDISVTTCVNANFECCKKAKCRSYKFWNELNSVIVDFLKNKTLDEYIKE
jgi:Rrf2 family protein